MKPNAALKTQIIKIVKDGGHNLFVDNVNKQLIVEASDYYDKWVANQSHDLVYNYKESISEVYNQLLDDLELGVFQEHEGEDYDPTDGHDIKTEIFYWKNNL